MTVTIHENIRTPETNFHVYAITSKTLRTHAWKFNENDILFSRGVRNKQNR